MKRLHVRSYNSTFGSFFLGVLGAVSIGGMQTSAHAQSWPLPGKSVRIVVPSGSGSAPDIRTRQFAPKLAELVGQPVIVENRPGADGLIGAREAAKGAPDGHTLFMGGINTHVLNGLINPSPSFQPEHAFVPVTTFAAGTAILVASPSFGATSLQDVLDRARARPGRVRYAVSGAVARLFGEMIKDAAGIDMQEIPYKTQAQELPELMSGQIDLSLTFLTVVSAHVQSGKVKAIAVASRQRHPALPDVPTFLEAGLPGVEARGWIGIFVPVKTPDPIIRSLHREIARALNNAGLRAQFLAGGVEPGGESPEEFAAFIHAETERWGKLIRERGIKLN